MRKFEVCKDDIFRLGSTQTSSSAGFLIICGWEHISNIEKLLLREILKCWGDEYKITHEVKHYDWDRDDELGYQITFFTNLPFDLYLESLG